MSRSSGSSAAYAALTGPFAPSITGAASAVRFVGGVASVAPTTGTFAVGDYVIARSGTIWICTVAGSPGTWVQVSGGGSGRPVPVTTNAVYAATVTPNVDTTDVLNIAALTGALTLVNPTGTPVDGQTLRVRFIQDGTGSRVITYDTAYAFGTDVTAGLDPSTASAKWERCFEWDAADSKWRATAIVRGF